MDKAAENKLVAPLLVFFIIVTGFCTMFKTWLALKNIDPLVLGFSNVLLFILSLAIVSMQKKSLNNKNPQVFIRAIMLGTFIKLMVIAIAVTIYLVAAGEQRSIYAILAAMFLYLVYTVIEVRISSKLNRRNGEG